MALALGSQTGSLMNHVMSCQTVGQPEPQVGMGVTMLGWTDRYAGTIIAVANGIVTVQEDRARRADANGMSEAQSYAYSPDPEGLTYHFRLRNGAWEQVRFNEGTKRWRLHQNAVRGMKLGERRAYHDYSF